MIIKLDEQIFKDPLTMKRLNSLMDLNCQQSYDDLGHHLLRKCTGYVKTNGWVNYPCSIVVNAFEEWSSCVTFTVATSTFRNIFRRAHLKKKMFVYFWLCWVFADVCQLFSDCSEQGLLSSCDAQASHCSGFCCCRAQALWCTGFSSCSTWVQLLWLPSCIPQAQ